MVRPKRLLLVRVCSYEVRTPISIIIIRRVLRLRRKMYWHEGASFGNKLSRASLWHLGNGWHLGFYPSWNRLYRFTAHRWQCGRLPSTDLTSNKLEKPIHFTRRARVLSYLVFNSSCGKRLYSCRRPSIRFSALHKVLYPLRIFSVYTFHAWKLTNKSSLKGQAAYFAVSYETVEHIKRNFREGWPTLRRLATQVWKGTTFPKLSKAHLIFEGH